jgi:copper amine oxidase-like protein
MKRFLSIFAIMALIVSMFSGVGFATPADGVHVTITAETTVPQGKLTADVDIAITPGDINDLIVQVVNASGTVVIDSITVSGNNIKLPFADVNKLTNGIYTVRVKPGEQTVSSQLYNVGEVVSGKQKIDWNDGTAKTVNVTVGELIVVPQCYINLNSNTISYSKSATTARVSGKIFNKTSNSTYSRADSLITIYKDLNGNGKLDAGEKNIIDQHKANNGEFSILISPNALGIGRYFVASETDKEAWFDETEKSYDSFVIAYDIELEEEISINYPASGQISITGVLTNEDGLSNLDTDDSEELVLAYIGDDDNYEAANLIAEAAFYNGKAFSFLFSADGKRAAPATAGDTSGICKVGDIGIFIKRTIDSASPKTTYTLVKTGKVKAGELSVTSDQASVVRGLGNQDITLDFDLSTTDYYHKETGVMIGDYTIRLYAKDSNDKYMSLKNSTTVIACVPVPLTGADVGTDPNKVEEAILTLATNSKAFTDIAKQKITVGLPVKEWRGSYKLYVELYNAKSGEETVVKEATIDLQVKNPSTYTVIGWGLKEHEVGDVVVRFPENAELGDTVVPNFTSTPENSVDVKLQVTKYKSTNEYPKYFEFTAEGAGLEKTTYNNFGTGTNNVAAEPGGAICAKIPTTKTGTLKLTVKAYFPLKGEPSKPATAAAYSFTKEVKINGWNLEITNDSVVVKSEQDLTFIVTDEEGTPVNNARVFIDLNNDGVAQDNEEAVNGTTANINAGTYTYVFADAKNDLTKTVGSYNVLLTKANKDVKVKVSNGFSVVGEEVYDVTADVESLVNGIEDTIYVKVVNEDGDIVYPSFEKITYNKDGKAGKPEVLNSLGRADKDGVSGNESSKFKITPGADDTKIVIRATTDNGNKMGQIELEVQKPQVVMSGATTLTENIYTNIQFQVVDPRDNTVIEESIMFSLSTYMVEAVVANPEDHDDKLDNVTTDTLDSDDDYVYNYDVLVTVTKDNWDKAAKDEKEVVLGITMGSVELEPIPVGKVSFTADPESMIIGSGANITMTYNDADGKPLKEREIYNSDNESIGTTNDEGQLLFVASSGSSTALTFKGETDNEIASKAVYSSLKVKSVPDIDGPVVEHKVVGNTAIITVSDESLIYTFYVNGKKVESLFPSKQQVYTVEGLQVGMNKVSVVAADKFFNPTMLELEIEVVAPQVEKVEFTLNNAIGDLGTPVKIGTTSMVPARLVEELGVSFAWDAEAQTVEYTYGETTVQLTVGSKTGIVNGENVPVAEAPYLNDKGRLMVPVRMVGQSLGFDVKWSSDDAPIIISKIVK